jgi:hypothetical protein
MSDDEIDEVVSFDTFEEALAHAMDDVGDDGIVSVHAEDCELRSDSENESACTCEPLILRLGAKA